MPKNYQGLGLQLLYPDNWTVEDEADSASVSIESPEGAFIAITKLDSVDDLQAAVEQAGNAMEAEYDDVEKEEFFKEIEELPLRGITQRFVYLDLIIVSHLMSFAINEDGYLIQIQAEDRDLTRLQVVFDAILTSAYQSLIA